MTAIFTVPNIFPTGFNLLEGEKVNETIGAPPYSTYTNITATPGGGQLNAFPLTYAINKVATVASNNDSVKLPLSSPGVVWVQNAGANTTAVFCTGANLVNGVTSVTQAAGETVAYVSAGDGFWYTLTSASGSLQYPVGGPSLPVTNTVPVWMNPAFAEGDVLVNTPVLIDPESGNVTMGSAFMDGDLTVGDITCYTTTATNVLNVGSSGNQGTAYFYPGTANTGSISIYPTDNADNFIVTLTNATYGQNSTLTIPDVGESNANFIMSSAAGGDQSIVGAIAVSGSVTTPIIYMVPQSGPGTLTIESASVDGDTTITIPEPLSSNANFIIDGKSGGQLIAGGVSIVGGLVADGLFSGPITCSGAISAPTIFAGSNGETGSITLYPGSVDNGYTSLSMTDSPANPKIDINIDIQAGNRTYTVLDAGNDANFGLYASSGSFTFVAGTFSVADPLIQSTSKVLLTGVTSGGVVVGSPSVFISPGVGFTATGAATDTSTYSYVNFITA